MKQQEVFKKIGVILKELNEQYEYLGQADEQLNDLELELFVANAHFLADHSEVLRKLNQQFVPPAISPDEAPQIPAEKFFEPVVQQIINEQPPIIVAEEPAPVFEFEAPKLENPKSETIEQEVVPEISEEPEIIKHELVIDESELWEDEEDTGFDIEEVTEHPQNIIHTPVTKDPVLPVLKDPEPLETKKATAAPVISVTEPASPKAANIESEEPLTVNQMIAAQLQKTGSLSEQLHAQSISDLKQAITLNDKLLYIKDLFNGYNLAYSEAIDLLNRCHSFEEAEEFLRNNYAVKNQWESKQATAEKFYELLRRRFA